MERSARASLLRPERLLAARQPWIRPWMRRATRVVERILYSVPLGTWGAWLASELDSGKSFWQAVISLEERNILLAATLIVIVLAEMFRGRREARGREAAVRYALRAERSTQRVLAEVLQNATAAVSHELRVNADGRFFRVIDESGQAYFVQARDLHTDNIPMPGEFGFTRVPVNDQAFVSARSFQSKTPLYEDLPEDHADTLYEPDVKTMIEASQRWVLSCPVLSVDGTTGDVRLDNPPHGVLVFYGTEVPKGRAIDTRVRHALRFGETAADAFSYVLEIQDAVVRLSTHD